MVHRLFGDTNDEDLMIVCGDYTRKIHSYLFCRQSRYFDRICKGNFQVTSSAISSLLIPLSYQFVLGGKHKENRPKRGGPFHGIPYDPIQLHAELASD